MSIPDRSLQQRRDALERANVIRLARAELKQELKAGKADISEILINPPDTVSDMMLMKLLLALPRMGKNKVNQIMTQCRIGATRTVGGLTHRQRSELVRKLTK